MGLERLNMETLKDLDHGAVMEAFQGAVRHAVLDCMDRPGMKAARKITLQLNLTPVARITDNTIDCEGCKGTCVCRVKIPDRETQAMDFGVQQSGDLIFNPDSPTNHRQTTLLDDE